MGKEARPETDAQHPKEPMSPDLDAMLDDALSEFDKEEEDDGGLRWGEAGASSEEEEEEEEGEEEDREQQPQHRAHPDPRMRAGGGRLGGARRICGSVY